MSPARGGWCEGAVLLKATALRDDMEHTMHVRGVASTHRGKGGCDMSRESCQLGAPPWGFRCMHAMRRCALAITPVT